ncbi:MAG TPA: hypothetical protein VLX91_16615 [Candidatus Acidoferrales bacterium]|nr:hypothetical protein [Candidatus Acidoferrales bacterium]
MTKKRLPQTNRNNHQPEYRLLIENFSDPTTKRSGTVFLFRTSEEFQNFVYELVVETERKDDKIFFKIVGLRTPLKDFPAAGPAICRCEIENLEPGVYTLLVDRRSKQINQFKVSIHKKIKILRTAREGRFIDVTTDRSEWSSR